MPINDSSALKLQSESEDIENHEPLGKYVSMELPDQAVVALNEVMRITGDTTESLFRKALDLYTRAVDAKADGCKLAIVDAEDNKFVQDIPGL
jgi:hypothetical protein